MLPSAFPLVRTLQRHVIAPIVIFYSAAISVCEMARSASRLYRKRASSVSRPYISYEQCGAVPLGRMCPRAGQVSGCAKRVSSVRGPHASYE